MHLFQRSQMKTMAIDQSMVEHLVKIHVEMYVSGTGLSSVLINIG